MENADQYLVVPKSRDEAVRAKLLEFLDTARKIPNVSVVRVVGDQDNPKRVIIQGTADAVKELKVSFERELIIEPDSSLKMF